MKAHVVENSVVVNTILVESLDVLPNLIDGEIGAIGWSYIDGQLIAPPESEPTPEPIPQSISPRQARLKLLEANLLDNLEAVITTNRAWQIEWEYATEVKRDSPLIDAVASEAGLTSDQIDQMFIEASEL
jgi:hypothetical protein